MLNLLASVDLYNGEIIAHRMVRRPLFELASGTLRAALSQFDCTADLTVLSDQGRVKRPISGSQFKPEATHRRARALQPQNAQQLLSIHPLPHAQTD